MLFRLNLPLISDKMLKILIRRFLRTLPLLLLTFSCIMIYTGSPYLMDPILEGSELPVGTIVAWVGIAMLPLSILLGIRIIRKPISVAYRFYNRAFRVLFLLSMAWGAVSYLLAGNWAITFSISKVFRGSEGAFSISIYYTAFTISASLLLFVIFLIHHLILQNKKQ